MRSRWMLALLFALSAPPPGTLAAADADDLFRQGAYREAAQGWRAALARGDAGPDHTLALSLRLADVYQILGHHAQAGEVLQAARALAEQHGTPAQRVRLDSRRADVFLALQQLDEAEAALRDALAQARAVDDARVLAEVANTQGNLWRFQEDYAAAGEAYARAARQARAAGDPALLAQVLGNAAAVAWRGGQGGDAAALAREALKEIESWPDGHAKALEYLRLGRLWLRLHQAFPDSQPLETAWRVLEQARRLAEDTPDLALKSYAHGYLGEVYEQAGRYAEAQRLTESARFWAQADEGLAYLWAWQQGRILQAQGAPARAAAAYREALDSLQPIRGDLMAGRESAQVVFREQVRPVYYALADVLLRQASGADGAAKDALLRQARDTLEQFKAAELQDYFQDACVAALRAEDAALDTPAPRTAVLYPVLLADRTELLLSLPDGMRQAVVEVGAARMEATLHAFRLNLENVSHWRYMEQARQLYAWLVAPFADLLERQRIDTLVFIPDGGLRTVPLAALHDGERYLIEKLAVVTTPGLALIEPQPLAREGISLLVNGLSQGVQGFAPLPNVPEEIRQIRALFRDSKRLLDQAFLAQSVSLSLQSTPYTVVHVASHGQFDRNPKKTFILTYDAKLNLDRLGQLLAASQFRDRPVELLTLSACQTAVGDERAALGLAGVAVKAGARSALASLWSVNDESTSRLVVEFYRALQDPALSKAQALQAAQQRLLGDRRFRHPLYWAPFLLIGNWL